MGEKILAKWESGLTTVRLKQDPPVIKRLEGLSTENLIATAKVIFAEYGIPCKLMAGTGTNFISDRFGKFCSSLNIELTVSSAYHHQSNGQVEACIKFIKCMSKNVQIPVGISTWLYYKYILLHWARACWAQQHYYSIDQSTVSYLS